MSIKNKIKKILAYSLRHLSNFSPFKTRLSVGNAREILSAFCPKPIGTCLSSNQISVEYDLQIIVPAYNVSEYIEECINSVLKQVTKYNVLMQIVDDGSADNTGEIIDKFFGLYGGV